MKYLGVGVIGADAYHIAVGIDNRDACTITTHPRFGSRIAVQGGVAFKMQQPLAQHNALSMFAVAMAMHDGVDTLVVNAFHALRRQRHVNTSILCPHRVGDWTVVKLEWIMLQLMTEAFVEMFDAALFEHHGDSVVEPGMHEKKRPCTIRKLHALEKPAEFTSMREKQLAAFLRRGKNLSY